MKSLSFLEFFTWRFIVTEIAEFGFDFWLDSDIECSP